MLEEEVKKIIKRYEFRASNETIKQMWLPFSEAEIAHRNQQQIAISKLLRMVGKFDLSGMKILDIGCGTGRILRQCLDYGASPENLYGVDIIESRIQKAQKLSPNIFFDVTDGLAINLPDEDFDLVMQFVVFSSIYSEKLRQKLAEEMKRLLKPGGYIFWWDVQKTVHEEVAELIAPQNFFPDMAIREIRLGQYPLPSQRISIFKHFKVLSKTLDFMFGCKKTHIAALVGPQKKLTGD